MHTSIAVPPIPVVRALMVAPWVASAQRLGAPAESLLASAGIRSELLQNGTAAVPLKQVLHWMRLACQSLGTEHLGLHVGCATSCEDLGPYGRALAGALTLYDYIHRGIALYGTVIVGQSVWLTTHGARVRVNFGAPWEPELGDYQICLNSIATTIANISRFAGAGWATEISLGFRTRETIPTADIFGETRVLYRPGQTYFEFPRALLGLRLRPRAQTLAAGQSALSRPLPTDLAGLVELQIESLLCGRPPVPIDLVAESLGANRRRVQRGLAAQGVSYTDLLAQVRLRRAAHWLEHTDKTVMEIALDLGYTDPSNFTRAFRRQTGVSPKAFRDTAGRS